jgi:hypothetical protein
MPSAARAASGRLFGFHMNCRFQFGTHRPHTTWKTPPTNSQCSLEAESRGSQSALMAFSSSAPALFLLVISDRPRLVPEADSTRQAKQDESELRCGLKYARYRQCVCRLVLVWWTWIPCGNDGIPAKAGLCCGFVEGTTVLFWRQFRSERRTERSTQPGHPTCRRAIEAGASFCPSHGLGSSRNVIRVSSLYSY